MLHLGKVGVISVVVVTTTRKNQHPSQVKEKISEPHVVIHTKAVNILKVNHIPTYSNLLFVFMSKVWALTNKRMMTRKIQKTLEPRKCSLLRATHMAPITCNTEVHGLGNLELHRCSKLVSLIVYFMCVCFFTFTLYPQASLNLTFTF